MRFLLLVACLALVLPACGDSASDKGRETSTSDEATTARSGPQELVSEFFQRQFEYRLWGQYDKAWADLNPGQKALVPRKDFVDCSLIADPNVYPSLEVKSVTVQSMLSDDEPPPVGVSEETLAVTMQVTVVDPGVRKETTTERIHTAIVDGRFVWMLPSEAVRAFQTGRCPSP